MQRRVMVGLSLVCCFALVTVFGQQVSPPTEHAGQTEWLNPLQSGEEVFGAMCASCHGVEGQGGFGPALAGNAALQSLDFIVLRIVNGAPGMPRLGPPQLTEEQISNVIAFIRTSWGNDFGEVDFEEVQERIQALRE